MRRLASSCTRTLARGGKISFMTPVLPHGAKGIQGDDFALALGINKIVFSVTPRNDEGGDQAAVERRRRVVLL